MGGRKQKPKHRHRPKPALKPDQGGGEDHYIPNPSAPLTHNHQFLTAKATQNKHVNWTLIITLIGSMAAIISGAIAYQSYKQANQQPELSLQVYKTTSGTEYYYDNLAIDLTLIKEENGIIEFNVPLKIINDSQKDAENITLWLASETDDVQLLCPPTSWTIEKYADKNWNVINANPMSPNTGAKFYGVRLQAKKGIHGANLSWKIFAARTSPKQGIITLSF